MQLIPMLLKEMDQEAQTTRKMLSIIPDDKYDWKPHPKSMAIRQLSTHIAELPTWVDMVLNTPELDFSANPYEPKSIHNTAELLDYFEASLKKGKEQLEQASEDQMNDTWVLRDGAQIYSKSSKYEMIRITYSQIVHHRAQLGVCLRLLNIPIPGSYGPSADDMKF